MTCSLGDVHINTCQNVTRTSTSFSQLQPLFCDGRWIISNASNANFLFLKGVAQLCESLRSCITSNLSLPLNARLTISELEAHLMQVTNFVLNSSIHFGPWANLGVLGNPKQWSFNEIVGHPLILLDGALEMSHTEFFSRNNYKCCPLHSCLTLWEATRVASLVIPRPVLFLERI